jgi:hypothetical protein
MLSYLTGRLADRVDHLALEERGAIGWLILGVIIGVIVVIVVIVQLLIPGNGDD